MSEPLDITGRRFGRLVALTHIKYRGWLCRCDCGRETIVSQGNLKRNRAKSCGCLRTELTRLRSYKHGHAGRKLHSAAYNSWTNMITRCTNPNNTKWKYYGGRGITVCWRWLSSFDNFLADMGERPPGLSLDRVNNDLGYSKANCRWATPLEQQRNRRPPSR